MRHALTLLGALAVAALTVLAIGGSSAIDGPIVLELTARHGLHRGDLLAVSVAGVTLLALAGLHRASRGATGRRGTGRGRARPEDGPAPRRRISSAGGRAPG